VPVTWTMEQGRTTSSDSSGWQRTFAVSSSSFSLLISLCIVVCTCTSSLLCSSSISEATTFSASTRSTTSRDMSSRACRASRSTVSSALYNLASSLLGLTIIARAAI